jgi:hypothetical protein
MVIVFLIPAVLVFLVALQMSKSPRLKVRRIAGILKIVAIVLGVAAILLLVFMVLILQYIS